MYAGLSRLQPSQSRIAAMATVWLVTCWAVSAHAQAIVAMVNGDPITAFDVEQRIKLIKLSEHKVFTSKEALEALIDDRVKIKEGKRFGLELSANDTDEQYAGMAKRMHAPAEQLSKILEAQG